MRQIGRDDLLALLDGGAVTLAEALPEPRYEAEHLPGALNLSDELTADLGGKADWAHAGLVLHGSRATPKAA